MDTEVITYLYPGQGAQRPRMFDSLPIVPPVEETLDTVSRVLGHDIRDLDTSEVDSDTVAAQLTLFTLGVVCSRLLAANEIHPRRSPVTPSELSPPRSPRVFSLWRKGPEQCVSGPRECGISTRQASGCWPLSE